MSKDMSERSWPSPPAPRDAGGGGFVRGSGDTFLRGSDAAFMHDSEGAHRHDIWLTRGVMFRRALALLMDLVIIAVIAAVLWVILALFGVLTFGLGMPLLAVLPAVPPLYHFGTLASPLSATPGQKLMGLSVRRNSDLGRPDVLEALISVAVFYATLALGAIWLAVALVTTRHRTLHDLLSGLVVVRSEAVPPLTGHDGAWNMRPGGPPPA
jgi:uncharacterized RDD family membrane protein YckC